MNYPLVFLRFSRKAETIIVLSSHKGFPDIFILKNSTDLLSIPSFPKNRTAKKSGIVLKRSIFVFPGGFFPRFFSCGEEAGDCFFLKF